MRPLKALSVSGTAILVACGGGGETGETSSVRLNRPLAISATAVAPGEPVTFQADCSSENLIVYAWYPGDGSNITPTHENTLTHAYEKEGQYHARVNCEGFRAARASSTAEVLVRYPRHQLTSIQVQSVRGSETTQVKFEADCRTDYPDLALSYVWNFGDGSGPAEGQVVTHEYSNNGTSTEYVATVHCNAQFLSPPLYGPQTMVSQTVRGTTSALVSQVAMPTIVKPLTASTKPGHGATLNMLCDMPEADFPLKYSFDFGDGSVIVQNTTGSAEHQYAPRRGLYLVNATCYGIDNAQQREVHQTLQVMIEGYGTISPPEEGTNR